MCSRAEKAGGARGREVERQDGRAGFALLEALVALAIIGTFAVAVLATLGAQVRTADRAAR